MLGDVLSTVYEEVKRHELEMKRETLTFHSGKHGIRKSQQFSGRELASRSPGVQKESFLLLLPQVSSFAFGDPAGMLAAWASLCRASLTVSLLVGPEETKD